MDIYSKQPIEHWVGADPYVGRGIVIGMTPEGDRAMTAYFIMGRSENSRNRIFVEKSGGEVEIRPFDPAKVEDPSLIIYSPIKMSENHLIVTNGDQTETIFQALERGSTFEEALSTRAFEPDAPNLTPRISGMLTFGSGEFSYRMSILKSGDAEGSVCNRYTYSYSPLAGLGHFIHTYAVNADPLPTFQGEPKRVAMPSDIEEFTANIWNHLDQNNKISLYVRSVDLNTGEVVSRMLNKNQ